MSKTLSKLSCLIIGVVSVNLALGQVTIESVAAYHNNSKWEKAYAQESFDRFYKEHGLKGDEKLLDLCSGDGKLSHYIAHNLPTGRVVGVDISPTMIEFSSKYYQSENLNFSQADIRDLNFNQAYDVITSFNCLHLVEDLESTIKGIEQSLKPNGKILIQIPYDDGLSYAIESIIASAKWQPYFSQFEQAWFHVHPDTYHHYLERAGLSPTRIEITQAREEYTSKGEFQASIELWLPHVQHLAEPLRGEFMEDLIKNYLRYMPIDKDGNVHYYVDRIEIEAVKPA